MEKPFFQGPAEQALVQAQVDIGRLETQVAHLSELVSELRSSNSELRKLVEASNKETDRKFGEIRDILSEARGGWKTMMWLGGAAASLGGAIVWAAKNLVIKG